MIKNVSVKLFSFINGWSIGDQERVCQTLRLLYWREYWWSWTCLSNSSTSSMEGVLVIKNLSVKLFSFINGGSIGDQESVGQTLQLLQWREYWWSRKCLSNSRASLLEGVLVIKNVSVKLFSFINGGSIGDQERVCQTLQLLQRREYWWWRTCLSNSSVSSVEAVLVIKNVSVKLFSFINGGSIGDEERVCQTLQFLQFLQWRQYWWSRTCLSNSSASSMEGVLVMKNVSVKLFSFFGGGSQERGGSIGDEERVCQTLQLLQWREYWWSRTCLSNSSASSMEGVLVMKNVSVKLFSFFSGGSIGDQERVCQSLQFHQWREYWWWRTCLSNSSASSMEGVLVIKTCLPNFTASSTEGVLVMKNVSVKLFSFFSGGSIGDQERVCQTLQLHQWREYWWWRTCLSNSSVSSVEAVLVIKNVSVKLFSFINGGSIGDQERVCQTLRLLYWREYWWSWTCLSNSSTSSMEGIGNQEFVCQTLQLH